MSKISNTEVIKKCKEVHGEKYDYSKVNYVNSKTKICIICKKHGEFYQYYCNHLKGCGCPSCAGNKRLTTNEYVSQLKQKFGEDKYSFDKVKYVNNHTPITLICKQHGEWQTWPISIYDKCECPECEKTRRHQKKSYTTEEFIAKSKAIHGNKYDYSKVEYINDRTKVCIICPDHGDFWQLPKGHLRGCGCIKCAITQTWNNRERMTTQKILQKFHSIHKDKYDYSKFQYIDAKTKSCIICPKHGEFMQLPYAHLNGQGCPKCGQEALSSAFSLTTECFINRAREIHHNKYDYSKVSYVNSKTKVEIICPKHGSFLQVPISHLKGVGCPMCYAELSVSKEEIELRNFIKNECSNSIRFNTRNTISPLELDVVDDNKKIAIEYDGLYWHSDEKITDKKYHLNKTLKCEEKGYQLIHIFEDEWLSKKDIVKSRLLNIFGKTSTIIGARKCIIKEVPSNIAKDFLETNHIQGNVNSSIRYGLYYNNELVSIMTFGKLRKNLGSTNKDGYYEMLRFCNKLNTTVIGGASRLLHYFINGFCPKKIISYADRRWSNGKLYYKLGFKHSHNSEPSYFYTFHGKTRENRFKYRKDVLIREGFCCEKSESQIMKERGYNKIYDCGCMVFEMCF